MKLSVVVAGRDDGYGDLATQGIYNLDFIPMSNFERIAYCLEQNLKNLYATFGDDFELIFIDWSPLKGRDLGQNSVLLNLDKTKKVRHIAVRKSAIKARKLNPKSFYEYHAKNVGLRLATGKYTLISNSDNFFTDKLLKEVFDVIEGGYNEFYYRPYSRIDIRSCLPFIEESEGFSFSDKDLFGKLGTDAAGDFILTQSDNLRKIRGFDENSNKPKSINKRQSALDGQLLIQLYISGIKPKVLQNSTYSISHNKIERNYYGMFLHSYLNDDSWGLQDRIIRFIDPGVYEVI